MSGGGFFGGGDSGSQNNDNASKRAIRPIRALMASQVPGATLEYDNPDGPVVIDDHPVSQAVLCVELLDVITANNSKRLKVADSTGTLEVRVPPFENEHASEYENHYNKFGNLYGHFRVFNAKPTFDFTRFDFNISPYQFLYHEVEAARESYHYQGLVTLGHSLSETNEDPVKHDVKGNEEESIFVAGNAGEDDDLRERILGIIQGFEDTGDGVTADYIAAELSLDEGHLKSILSRLENDAKVYEIDNYWRAN